MTFNREKNYLNDVDVKNGVKDKGMMKKVICKKRINNKCKIRFVCKRKQNKNSIQQLWFVRNEIWNCSVSAPQIIHMNT